MLSTSDTLQIQAQNRLKVKDCKKIYHANSRQRRHSYTNSRQNRIYYKQALKLKLLLKIFQKTKAQDQMASQVNSIKHLEKS